MATLGGRMSIDDQIRQQIVDRQRMRWSRITAVPGIFGKLMQTIAGKSPAEGIFIAEHEVADSYSFLCGGAALAAWRLDRNGMRDVAPAEVSFGNTIGRLSQFQVARFFISDDDQQIFLNEMEGPKQGMLMHMQPRLENGAVQKLRVRHAKIVLNGTSVG